MSERVMPGSPYWYMTGLTGAKVKVKVEGQVPSDRSEGNYVAAEVLEAIDDIPAGTSLPVDVSRLSKTLDD